MISLRVRSFVCDLFVTFDECIHFHGMLTPGCTGNTPKKKSHVFAWSICRNWRSNDITGHIILSNRTTNLKNCLKEKDISPKKLMFKDQSHLIILSCHWILFTNSTAIFHAKSPLVRPVKHLQSPLWLLDWPASNEFLLDLGPLPPLQQWWLPPPWD